MSKYKILDKGFSKKDEITTYYQKILRKSRKGTSLNSSDLKYVIALLDYHHQKDEKIGCGIKNITRETHTDYYTGYESKHCHFHIWRTDGSNEDFSYKKCISNIGTTKKAINKKQNIQNVVKAFRYTIKPQVDAFRAKVFNNKRYLKCEVLGINFSKVTCHIDHQPPLQFNDLLNDFLIENSLNIQDIEVKNLNGIFSILKDKKLSEKWEEYHLNNAKLRPIHRAANLSQKRSKVVFK